jgi:hypothetical protein
MTLTKLPRMLRDQLGWSLFETKVEIT